MWTHVYYTSRLYSWRIVYTPSFTPYSFYNVLRHFALKPGKPCKYWISLIWFYSILHAYFNSNPGVTSKGIPRAATVLGIFSRPKPFLALFLAFGNAGFLPLQQALCAGHMGAETAGRAWGGLHPVRRGAGPGRKGSRGHTPVQGWTINLNIYRWKLWKMGKIV